MSNHSRREFLQQVGRGMLVAGVGYGTALDIGLTSAWAEEAAQPLTFGALEPLVRPIQDTTPDKLLPLLAGYLAAGAPLRERVPAGALAHVRTFGGEDYIGFHTMMALVPSFEMAGELPESRRALPVFKVLYRNGRRIMDHGGHESEVLHQIATGP